MKKSQKLRLCIEDLSIETTYEKLPEKLKFLADRLEMCEDPLDNTVLDTIITSGGACLFVSLSWIGKPSRKTTKILGYDADELMARQYK